jgi:hypothetical protein
MSRQSVIHQIVRLGMELGLAVNDYNSHATDTFDDVIRATILYLAKVKEGVREGKIQEEEIPDYFALVGQSWGSIMPRNQ